MADRAATTGMNDRAVSVRVAARTNNDPAIASPAVARLTGDLPVAKGEAASEKRETSIAVRALALMPRKAGSAAGEAGANLSEAAVT